MKKNLKFILGLLFTSTMLVSCKPSGPSVDPVNPDTPVDPVDPVDPDDNNDPDWITDDNDGDYPDDYHISSINISDDQTYVCGDIYAKKNRLRVVVSYDTGVTRKVRFSKLQTVYVKYGSKTIKTDAKMTDIGIYTVQVKYGNKKSNIIEIDVQSNVSTVAVSDNKTYHVGDVYSFNNDLLVTGTYSDGSSFSVGYDDLDYANCYLGSTSAVQNLASGFGAPGVYTITCAYGGKVAEPYTVNVVDFVDELSTKAKITFGGFKSETGYTNGKTIVDNYTVTNDEISLSSINVFSVYGGSGASGVERKGLRVGSGSGSGSITFNFNEYFKIASFKLLVRPFEGNSNGSTISAKTSTSDKVVTATVAKDNDNPVHTLVFSGFDVSTAANSITLDASYDNAFYLYQVGFDFEDVLPTSINIPDSLTLAVNDTKTINLEFDPTVTKRGVSWTSSNTDVASVSENGEVKGLSVGTTTITCASTADTNIKKSCAVTVTALSEVNEKTKLDYTYQDYKDNSVYNVDVAPAIGNPKLLVIPVWFTDSNLAITSESSKESIRQDIQKAYFGTEEETGWESVKTYYQKDSFGHVNINGTVAPTWFECGSSHNEVKSAYGDTTSIVTAAVNWYKTNYESDLTSYDTDNDGYLDGVILIYGWENYSRSDESEPNTNLWAYCYWCQDTSVANVENPGANAFFWASYDFMTSAGDTSNCLIDTHTYIHEMGHVFGLDDYYDYNQANYAAGMFSMQDCNVGGHDPYSRVALGWADPYVVSKPSVVTIKPMETSGDVILVKPNFSSNSPFDEYLLVEFYSPTGLNKHDVDYRYEGHDYQQGPDAYGIRIWHVDSRLMYAGEDNVVDNQIVWSDERITTSISSNYGYELACSNTTDKGDGTKQGYLSALESFRSYKLLHLLQKDGGIGFSSTSSFTYSDLWYEGETFTMEDYSTSFVNGTTFNDGTEFGFKIIVTSLTEESATISIVNA